MPNITLAKLMETGEYRSLQQEAMRMALDSKATADQRAEAFWYASTAAHHRENYYGATQLAESGLSLAKLSNNPTLEARLHFKLGGLYIWVGDLVQAEEHLGAFLAAAADGSPSVQVGMAHYNTGLIHLHRSDFAAAIVVLQQAAPLLLQTGAPLRSAQAEMDTAWAFMQCQELDQAARHLALAENLLQASPDDATQTHLLCYQAQYHRLRGDLRTATVCCEAVLAPGRPGANPHHLAEAAWNAGEIALASGRVEEASIFADVAHQYALVRLYPLLFNLVGDLRRRIRERALAV